MSTEKNNLPATVSSGNSVRPLMATDIEGAWRMATAFAQSGMLPKSYAGENKVAAAFTAMQLGAEVGLTPMASIQNIAVVNGNPRIWGDAQLAIVRNSGKMEYIKEYYEGEEYKPDFKAVCAVKRRGEIEVKESFSVADATKAGLWNKQGPWTQYPKRMLKYRARAFALRDSFSDCLLGLAHTMEEEDIAVGVGPDKARDVTPSTTLDAFEEQHAAQAEIITPEDVAVVEDVTPQAASITVKIGTGIQASTHKEAAEKLKSHLDRYVGADERKKVLVDNQQLINEIYQAGHQEEAKALMAYHPGEGGQA